MRALRPTSGMVRQGHATKWRRRGRVGTIQNETSFQAYSDRERHQKEEEQLQEKRQHADKFVANGRRRMLRDSIRCV